MAQTMEEREEQKERRLPRETAPSQMIADEPHVARILGSFALILVSLGLVAILAPLFLPERRLFIGPTLGWNLLILGLAGLLFHAARDADLQFRRSYGVVGIFLIVAAFVLAGVQLYRPAPPVFLSYGVPALVLGLLFALAFLRHEDDERWRKFAFGVVALSGLALGAVGLVGSLVSEKFALPHGLVASLVGLIYLWAYVGMHGAESERGHFTAVGMGLAGAIVFFIAFIRSAIPPLFYAWRWLSGRPDPYLVPTGLLLMFVGLFYLGLAVGLYSDNRLVVMTRRELAAFFYSPIAYIVLFCFSVLGWVFYAVFVYDIGDRAIHGVPTMEPIVAWYIISWWAIIAAMVILPPLLTMRLLSEEQRTGCYEVLMTSPVSETMVVLSKFFAALLFYLLLWLPWGFYLLAFRVSSGQEFEYRPLLSFGLSVTCMGAGFLSMGLFFSSLTRNQIIAFVMTAAFMIMFTLLFFIKPRDESDIWAKIISHISGVELWIKALAEGTLSPARLLFHASSAVFWLFLTVKVLESRKWR